VAPSPFAQLPASSRRAVVLVAATLIAADSLFVVGDLLQRAAVLHDPRLLLTTERGYPEMLQYAKFAWVALALSVTAFRWKSFLALAWAFLFVFLLLDDLFQLHEAIGQALAARVDLPAWGNLRPGHVGEALFLSTVGAMVGILALLAWRRGRGPERELATVLVGGVALLALFGVAVDLVHSAASGRLARLVLAVVEEGGEMVAASLVSALVLIPLARRRTAPAAEDGLSGPAVRR
jgi:hypothetical protein